MELQKKTAPVLTDYYENETDFVICVFNCVMYYVVTIYDSAKQTHARQKSFADRETAKAFAMDLNKKYQLTL